MEFQVPYEYPPAELRARLGAHGLKMVLFDAPMGDWSAGDRGLAAVPGREAQFRASLPRVVEYAQGLDCDVVHIMAGVVGPSTDLAQAEQVYIQNLRYAAAFLQPHGVRAVIEPINRRLGVVQGGPSYTTEGMHGYFLNHSDQARRIIERVGSENLFLHLDVYHMQMLEGIWRKRCAPTSTCCSTCRSPGYPGGMSRTWARSTTRSCSICWMRSVTADGWAANTARGRAPRPDWAGRGLMGSRHREPECPGARGRGAMRSGLSSHAYAAPGAMRRPSTTSWIGGV